MDIGVGTYCENKEAIKLSHDLFFDVSIARIRLISTNIYSISFILWINHLSIAYRKKVPS